MLWKIWIWKGREIIKAFIKVKIDGIEIEKETEVNKFIVDHTREIMLEDLEIKDKNKKLVWLLKKCSNEEQLVNILVSNGIPIDDAKKEIDNLLS